MLIKSTFRYLINHDKYKLIYFLIVILVLYGHYVLGINEDNAIKSILLPFQNGLFNLLFFLTTFITSQSVVDSFNSSLKSAIIRLKSKNKYLLSVILLIILVFLYNLFVFGMIFFPLVVFTKIGSTNVTLYETYNINSLIYLIYYLFRYFIILLVFNIISIYILFNFGKLKSSIFQIIILFLELSGSLHLFSKYLYSSFKNDLAITLIKIIVYMIIVFLLHIYTLKKKEMDIG